MDSIWPDNESIKVKVEYGSISKQRREVNEIVSQNKSLTVGSIWQVISLDWYEKWKKFVDFDNGSNNYHLMSSGDVESYNDFVVIIYI